MEKCPSKNQRLGVAAVVLLEARGMTCTAAAQASQIARLDFNSCTSPTGALQCEQVVSSWCCIVLLLLIWWESQSGTVAVPQPSLSRKDSHEQRGRNKKRYLNRECRALKQLNQTARPRYTSTRPRNTGFGRRYLLGFPFDRLDCWAGETWTVGFQSLYAAWASAKASAAALAIGLMFPAKSPRAIAVIIACEITSSTVTLMPPPWCDRHRLRSASLGLVGIRAFPFPLSFLRRGGSGFGVGDLLEARSSGHTPNQPFRSVPRTSRRSIFQLQDNIRRGRHSVATAAPPGNERAWLRQMPARLGIAKLLGLVLRLNLVCPFAHHTRKTSKDKIKMYGR